MTINILGYDFEVVRDNRLKPPHVGECNTFKGIITIKKGLSGQMAHSVLIHEAIEAIDEILELKLKHRQICGLEAGINSLTILRKKTRRKSRRNLKCRSVSG